MPSGAVEVAAAAGPAVAAVIRWASTSTLGPIAAALSLDPATVSATASTTYRSRDVSPTPAVLEQARARDDAAPPPAIADTHAAAVAAYTAGRGYTPMHPVGAVPGADLPADAAQQTSPLAAAPGRRRPAHRRQAPTVGQAARRRAGPRARVRQELIDLVVGSARRLRAELPAEQWAAWAAAEKEQADSAQRTTRIGFRDAHGAEQMITAADAVKVAGAYAELIGRESDCGPGFFAEHGDAVLAHAVHVARSDTPAEAVGQLRWRGYLDGALGDEQQARAAVARDVTAALITGLRYATRADEDTAWDLQTEIETVVDRWGAGTGSVWDSITLAALPQPRVLLDRALTARHVIAPEPFDVYDTQLLVGDGGVYSAEYGAVEALGVHLAQLRADPDDDLGLLADEIDRQAHDARALPTGTRTQRAERQ